MIKRKRNSDSIIHEFQRWFKDEQLENKVYIDLNKNEEGLHISSIEVLEKKKQGLGRKIFDKLIELSNKYNVPLILEASEYSSDSNWIQNWYVKLGFEYIDEYGDYGPIMKRKPTKKNPYKESGYFQRKRSLIKRRKNPKLDEMGLTDDEKRNLYKDLQYSILNGFPDYLASAIAILNTGNFCTDCENNIKFCKCEYCTDCDLPRCLCEWDIKKDKWNGEYVNKTRKAAWQISKEIFDNKQLIDFKKEILSLIKDKSNRNYFNSMLKI